MESTRNSGLDRCHQFFRGRALPSAKIVLKKGNYSKWRTTRHKSSNLWTAFFLLSDGQSTTRLIPSFSKLNYLTNDMLLSMLVLTFIVFGLAEVEGNFFWRTLEISFWPLFVVLCQKMAKMSYFERHFSTTRATIILKLGNHLAHVTNKTFLK